MPPLPPRIDLAGPEGLSVATGKGTRDLFDFWNKERDRAIALAEIRRQEQAGQRMPAQQAAFTSRNVSSGSSGMAAPRPMGGGGAPTAKTWESALDLMMKYPSADWDWDPDTGEIKLSEKQRKKLLKMAADEEARRSSLQVDLETEARNVARIGTAQEEQKLQQEKHRTTQEAIDIKFRQVNVKTATEMLRAARQRTKQARTERERAKAETAYKKAEWEEEKAFNEQVREIELGTQESQLNAANLLVSYHELQIANETADGARAETIDALKQRQADLDLKLSEMGLEQATKRIPLDDAMAENAAERDRLATESARHDRDIKVMEAGGKSRDADRRVHEGQGTPDWSAGEGGRRQRSNSSGGHEGTQQPLGGADESAGRSRLGRAEGESGDPGRNNGHQS